MSVGRIPLSIMQYLGIPALQSNDVMAYWFYKGDAALGADPWRIIEAFDPHINGKQVDVWFITGRCLTVDDPGEQIIFISQKDYDQYVTKESNHVEENS